LRVIAGRLGWLAGRLAVTQRCGGVPSPRVACGPVHSVVMLPWAKSPSSGRSERLAAGLTDHVVWKPVSGSRSRFSRPAAPNW
jgi:hypothetical protein